MDEKSLKHWFAVSIATLACGCVVDAADVQVGGGTPSEGSERRLVQREYPYVLDEGTISCADWEVVAASGEVLGLDRETYPIANMNRLLSLAGTDDEVPNINVELREALAVRGIDRIESCQDARDYLQLREERRQVAYPGVGRKHPDVAPPIEAGLDAEPVDKILNSTAFDHHSTVGITMGDQLCTGNLIGPFALVTAAHCVEQTGLTTVRAWIQRAGGPSTCISHAGATCPANPVANAYVQKHPNYDGTADWDQAVVIVNPVWRAPANTSDRWTRFAADVGLPYWVWDSSDVVRIAGYGRNAETASTSAGVGRRGNSHHFIDWVDSAGTTFGIERGGETSSGSCTGDSGGGAHNTTIISSASMMLGVLKGAANPMPNLHCAVVGAQMYYSVPDGEWISRVVNFFGGACTTLTSVSANEPYVKCW